MNAFCQPVYKYHNGIIVCAFGWWQLRDQIQSYLLPLFVMGAVKGAVI